VSAGLPHSNKKPGNRKLVAFFKVVIVAVLVMPWLVAGLIGASFYQSVADFNHDVSELQERINVITGQKSHAFSQLEYAEKQLVEVTEEKEALQRTARDSSADPENFDYEPAAGTGGGVMGLGSSAAEEGSDSTNSTAGAQDKSEEGVETTPTSTQLEDLARQVIRGNWGNGLARVLRLTDAGHDHVPIQQRVNEIIWGN